MVVLLPEKLGKKISDLKRAKGKGWEKELARAIDVILAEDLLLTPPATERKRAVKALGKVADRISKRIKLSDAEIVARIKK